MEIDFEKVQEERLPTLYEVLLQQTSPPVDSWAFYTYLSQFPYAIDYLDFWIDLMAHIRLCKDYVKGIRESIETYPHDDSKVEEQPQQGEEDDDNMSVTSSALLDALLNEGYLDFQNTKRVSQFLKGNTDDSPRLSRLVQEWKRQSGISDDVNGDVRGAQDDNHLTSMVDQILMNQTRKDKQPKITRKQLINSALQICNIYLLTPERSPKYMINVPDSLKMQILRNVQSEHRHDPDVFERLKTLAYQFLEMDCFPKFLGKVALHNIHDQLSDWRHNSTATLSALTTKDIIYGQQYKSPFSNNTVISRVLIGLLWLGIGFWIGYVLIFLHYSRAIRVVIVVPFALGCYSIVCGLYQVDIIYSWFGLTQSLISHQRKFEPFHEKGHNGISKNPRAPTFFAFLGGRSRLIVIQHPFIKTLLLKRGIWCCCLVIISTAILTVIFSCVPGYRL